MKDKLQILAAPCGVYCGACPSLHKGTCYSCSSDDRSQKRTSKWNCKIRRCCVDEHKFEGYCLKGHAKIIERGKFNSSLIKAWEDKLTSRITRRLLKNIRGEKSYISHPEAALPKPAYLIVVEVANIVDLTPRQLK